MKQLLSRGTNGSSPYTAVRLTMQASGRRRLGELGMGAALRDPLVVYLGVLIAVCVGLALLGVRAGYGLGEPWAVFVLAGVAAVSVKQRVTIRNNTEASISLIPVLLAAVLFGPVAGMTVAAISNLGAFGAPYMRWAVWTCSSSITGAVAGLFAGATLSEASNRPTAYLTATALAAVAAELCEMAFLGLTLKLRGKSALDAVLTLAPVAVLSVLLYAPLVALLAIAYEESFATDVGPVLGTGTRGTAAVRRVPGGSCA